MPIRNKPSRVEVKSVTRNTPTEKDKGNRKYKDFEKLRKYQEVQTWLRTIGESSVSVYLNALKKFCDFSEKSPHELILMRDKETRNSDPNSRTGVRDLILDFRRYLEMEKYAPKTINAIDGSVRSFFTAVLGKSGMINVKNYRNREVAIKKDLVPTLEELRKMMDVSNLPEKIRILFIAQTGMRISDALKLKVGDIQRELDLGRFPLAISYLPQKDRESIGERITFLASDGVELLKRYLDWRQRKGEKISSESPLFIGRTRRGNKPLTQQKFNKMLKNVAAKAGLNGDGKYGIIRAHSLRKFFITQLTNHGVEDKIINFLTCHKISEVDRVYWSRRVEQLRSIYAQRQQYLNPISLKREYDLNKLKDIKAKIRDLERKMKELEKAKSNSDSFDAKIATSEEEIVELAKIGYDCQPVGMNRWLMKKQICP